MWCWCRPLVQAKPAVATCAASGRIPATRPPSTETSRPHRASQMRQNVCCVRGMLDGTDRRRESAGLTSDHPYHGAKACGTKCRKARSRFANRLTTNSGSTIDGRGAGPARSALHAALCRDRARNCVTHPTRGSTEIRRVNPVAPAEPLDLARYSPWFDRISGNHHRHDACSSTDGTPLA